MRIKTESGREIFVRPATDAAYQAMLKAKRKREELEMEANEKEGQESEEKP